MAKQHTVSIFIKGDTWMAHHSDPAIREIFDTNILPTAYKSQMSANQVIASLKEDARRAYERRYAPMLPSDSYKKPNLKYRFDPTKAFGAVTWEAK